jgi:hypothetical protein
MNANSKKLANHEAAIALHYMHYNFCRIHQTLRVMPRWKRQKSNTNRHPKGRYEFRQLP